MIQESIQSLNKNTRNAIGGIISMMEGASKESSEPQQKLSDDKGKYGMNKNTTNAIKGILESATAKEMAPAKDVSKPTLKPLNLKIWKKRQELQARGYKSDEIDKMVEPWKVEQMARST